MNATWQSLFQELSRCHFAAVARAITLVENEATGYESFLEALPHQTENRIIGITGPPGAGKSTITDGLIGECIKEGKKVAVLCVDPSSPFNMGAILGDRIRMSQWYTHPQVFIRSLASRGSLGGLHPKIIEISEVLKAAHFDYILIETVGVGQSEVEIAGLADATVVVLVPESGDDVQIMKAGVMEIADVFVVNKCDRPDADLFIKSLLARTGTVKSSDAPRIPVLKTAAHEKKGIQELFQAIGAHLQYGLVPEKKYLLLARRVYHIIRDRRVSDIQLQTLVEEIRKAYSEGRFNLYQIAARYP